MNWKTIDSAPNGQGVLIFDPTYGIFIAEKWIAAGGHAYWSERTTSCGCCSALLAPTFWMELPEEPRE